MGQTEAIGQTEASIQVRQCLAELDSRFGRRSMAPALGLAGARGRHAITQASAQAQAQMQALAQATARQMSEWLKQQLPGLPVLAERLTRMRERERLLGILEKLMFAWDALIDADWFRSQAPAGQKAGVWIYMDAMARSRQWQQLTEEAVGRLRKLAAADDVDGAIQQKLSEYSESLAWAVQSCDWGLPDPGQVHSKGRSLEAYLQQAEFCVVSLVLRKWGMRCLWPLLGGVEEARRGLWADLKEQGSRCGERLQRLRELMLGWDAVEKHYESLLKRLADS